MTIEEFGEIIYDDAMRQTARLLGVNSAEHYSLKQDSQLPRSYLELPHCDWQELAKGVKSQRMDFMIWRGCAVAAYRELQSLPVVASDGSVQHVHCDTLWAFYMSALRYVPVTNLLAFAKATHAMNYCHIHASNEDYVSFVKTRLMNTTPEGTLVTLSRMLYAMHDLNMWVALIKLCNKYEFTNMQWTCPNIVLSSYGTHMDELFAKVESHVTAYDKILPDDVAKDLIELFERSGIHGLMTEVFKTFECSPASALAEGNIPAVFSDCWKTLHKQPEVPKLDFEELIASFPDDMPEDIIAALRDNKRFAIQSVAYAVNRIMLDPCDDLEDWVLLFIALKRKGVNCIWKSPMYKFNDVRHQLAQTPTLLDMMSFLSDTIGCTTADLLEG